MYHIDGMDPLWVRERERERERERLILCIT